MKMEISVIRILTRMRIPRRALKFRALVTWIVAKSCKSVNVKRKIQTVCGEFTATNIAAVIPRVFRRAQHPRAAQASAHSTRWHSEAG